MTRFIAARLMAAQYGPMAKGFWSDERESNFLAGAAPFCGTYECADGRYLALGPIEPRYRELLAKCGIAYIEICPPSAER